jgi:hypothetical protein
MGKKKKVSKHLNVSSNASSATSTSPSSSQPEFSRSASMPAEKFSRTLNRLPTSPEDGIAEHG